MRVLAIDPGNVHSGWVVIDVETRRPIRFGKDLNTDLRRTIIEGGFEDCDGAVIEMIASYGMAVGASVFATCVWIGRFTEAIRLTHAAPPQPSLVYRRAVKDHHCNNDPRAKDANVRQALIDRFALGVRNYGKGTKAAPGWFYGFSADVWQAYALAVYVVDADDMQEQAS